MMLPYSVLKSKRKPHIRIIETTDENIDSKNMIADFGKQFEDIENAKLAVEPNHAHFVLSNISYFYRNNLAIIFLTMNIMSSGESFISSMYYPHFIDYITKNNSNYEKNDTFLSKLNIEIKAYRIKIERLMQRLGI
jgi:hypothetical protein